MAIWRMMVMATGALTAGVASARADECEALAANLNAQIPALAIADRTATDQSVVVKLKHPDAEEISLACTSGEAVQPAELTAKWGTAWPPTRFYDLVSSAGAIVAANSEPAIRSGAVICAQRALTADSKSAIFEVNGTHFECSTKTGVDPLTSIRISKLKDAQQH